MWPPHPIPHRGPPAFNCHASITSPPALTSPTPHQGALTSTHLANCYRPPVTNRLMGLLSSDYKNNSGELLQQLTQR
ncbi:hypothetical protein CgunFtcFv8_015563 [Champsocephalus gunnari]|uniref:Uncharacterized protein n=1 Tax=Champsocephalus gunnari TaxID=52237 RepID=A0AAN8H3F4_CHAGU|nr:hypothetical protein CgunFtcFv8_015563 [Champsocephalus gunnari]